MSDADSLGVAGYWSTMDYLSLTYEEKKAKRTRGTGYFRVPCELDAEQLSDQKKKKRRRMASRSRTINRGGRPTTKR